MYVLFHSGGSRELKEISTGQPARLVVQQSELETTGADKDATP